MDEDITEYMVVEADYVGKNGNSALLKCENGFVEINKYPATASDGDAFHVPDCMSAGRTGALVYLPLSRNKNGELGYLGETIDGKNAFVGLGSHLVYSSFHEAAREALMDTPIATTTLHLSSFADCMLDKEQMEYFKSRASLESYRDLLDEALSSRTEDNLDNMSFDAISPLCLDQDRIEEILGQKKTPAPGM